MESETSESQSQTCHEGLPVRGGDTGALEQVNPNLLDILNQDAEPAVGIDDIDGCVQDGTGNGADEAELLPGDRTHVLTEEQVPLVADPGTPEHVPIPECGWQLVEENREVSIEAIVPCDSLCTRKVDPTHVEMLVHVVASGKELPPLVVDEHLVLVGGYHRRAALLKEGRRKVRVTVYWYNSDKDRFNHAYALNAEHGKPYSFAEKHAIGLRWFKEDDSIESIAERLSVCTKTVENWTRRLRDAEKEKKRTVVLELQAEGKTAKEIMDATGLPRAKVRTVLGSGRKRNVSESTTKEGLVPTESVSKPASRMTEEERILAGNDLQAQALGKLSGAHKLLEETKAIVTNELFLRAGKDPALKEVDLIRQALNDLEKTVRAVPNSRSH